MRLIQSFGQKLVIDEDSQLAKCYRRTCNKCKELLPTAPSVSASTVTHVDNIRPASSTSLRINQIDVHPLIVRKTPKFPSRERHLAIKRRKQKKKPGVGEEIDDDEADDDDELETVTDDLADEEERMAEVVGDDGDGVPDDDGARKM